MSLENPVKGVSTCHLHGNDRKVAGRALMALGGAIVVGAAVALYPAVVPFLPAVLASPAGQMTIGGIGVFFGIPTAAVGAEMYLSADRPRRPHGPAPTAG